MNAGSFFPGEPVSLTQCACRTFDVMEDRVNDGGRETNRDTSPCVMRNRFHHHLPRRMPHSLVQPQCLLNHVRIDSVGLPGIFPFLWSGGSYTGGVVGLFFVRLILGDSKTNIGPHQQVVGDLRLMRRRRGQDEIHDINLKQLALGIIRPFIDTNPGFGEKYQHWFLRNELRTLCP